jgi:hypothetical protein
MAANPAILQPRLQQSTDVLAKDAEAANLLSNFLSKRDVQDITHVQADLCVVCGSSVLATV